MKASYLVLSFVSFAASHLFATTLPAPLPSFGKSSPIAAAPASSDKRIDDAFFTGKPFDSEAQSYLFIARNYCPDFAQWTSLDPSGFPDGPNQHAYAPIPTSELDYAGLLAIKAGTTGTAGTINWGGVLTLNGEFWTAVTTKGHEFQVFKPSSVASYTGTGTIDWSMNCHGYTFLSGYWVHPDNIPTVLADEWKEVSQDKARIVVYDGGAHSAKVTTPGSNPVTDVTGKDGAGVVQTLNVNSTGYGNPKFYE